MAGGKRRHRRWASPRPDHSPVLELASFVSSASFAFSSPKSVAGVSADGRNSGVTADGASTRNHSCCHGDRERACCIHNLERSSCSTSSIASMDSDAASLLVVCLTRSKLAEKNEGK
ncbi:hypothetical protein GQ55_1G323700 [Panicum hallii var. hallii]|uniref:Uncharacterized protein n=1 Tax=Panicum hallii var. hallii TaxID=1504633 RepID=A0A2T7F9U9_9POAL|nr:hypothetical protein GQ55_1G323700 [Panicum hallii var. hallii]